MNFTMLFQDNPDANPDIRQTHLPAHLAFLECHWGIIKSAGSSFEAEGRGTGGLWLLKAERKQALQALSRADLFWTTGLRKTHRILQSRQVFAEVQRRA